jgi:hypothetical protein
VREPDGGCTGKLDLDPKAWEETARIPIPQWRGLHDRMVVYERKTIRKMGRFKTR